MNNASSSSSSSNECIKLTTASFMSWLEKQFHSKYEISLECLQERIKGLFTLFKLILEQVMQMDKILSEDLDSSIYQSYKPLIDNMVILLDSMIKDYTEFLDLEVVLNFFISVKERRQILLAHLHQIFHLLHSDANIATKLNHCIKVIDNGTNLIETCMIELHERAELSVPLLKHIKDCKTMFKIPLKKLKDEIDVLACDKSSEEFETVMEDIENRSKGTMKFKLDFVNKMIDLVKEKHQYLFELNKMLKPYAAMSNLIKTKGKKLLNENMKSTDQAKLLKYVHLLVQIDFCNSSLPSVDVNEMIYIIKLLESQVNLVAEYKKTLLRKIEEYQPMNTIEFEVTVEKYKLVMVEVNNFEDFSHKNFENIKLNKDVVNQILKDICKVVDKYKFFQNGVFHYQGILELFQKIRNLVAKFCYSEFNKKVELICEWNL